jgi:hypothetical protein
VTTLRDGITLQRKPGFGEIVICKEIRVWSSDQKKKRNKEQKARRS